MLTREADPEDDDELEQFINERRQRGLLVDYDAVEVMPPAPSAVPAGANGIRRALIDSLFLTSSTILSAVLTDFQLYCDVTSV